MRTLTTLLGAASVATLGIAAPAYAQVTAKVVASCGSSSYTAGTANYQTQDTTGKICTSSTGSGGGAVTIADGADVTLGSKADAATCATTNTLIACLRALNATAGAPASLTTDTHAQCSALCANLVVKASAGTLKTFEVSADSTLSGGIWYVIVYDATSAPADGAVTPAKCYQQPSGTTQMGGTLSAGGSSFTTGVTIGVSTTGCFTKTASTHAFIAADYQ